MAMSRNVRRSLYALGGFLGLLVVAFAAAYGVLQTSWAHAHVAAALENALGGNGMTVKIGALDGSLPNRIVLHDVTASDADGVWAKIGRVTLVWDPWRLLFKSVDVDSLTVADATLDRLPRGSGQEKQSTPQSGSFSAPLSLPDIGLEIAKVQIDMMLGPALTDGKEERLRAEGAGRYGMGDGLHVTLDATQGAANGSHLTARIHANPDDETLDLNLRAHEVKGGLVSRLLGVADKGPFDIDVIGDGTLMNWNGTAKASLGKEGKVDAKIRASGQNQPQFTITGTATGPSPLAGRLERLGEPPYDFTINFLVPDRSNITFKDTTIKTAGGTLTASGTVDLAKGSLNMDLGLHPGAGLRDELTKPLSVPQLDVTAHVRGYLSAPYVELSVAAPSLAGDGVSAGRTNMMAELDFDTGDPGTLFTFDASGSIAKLAFDQGETAGEKPARPSDVLLRTKGAYRGKIERLSFGDLMARSDWATVNFAGGINLARDANTMLTGRLTAELRGLPMARAKLADFLKQPARFKSSVVYMPEGERIKFANLSLDHPKLSVEGDVEVGLKPQSLRGSLKAHVADPAAFSGLAGIELAGGPIDLTLMTEPSGSAVNSTVTASADTLSISGTRLRSIKASLTLNDVGTQSGKLSVAFTGPAGAVKADTRIARSRNPDRISLDDLKVTAAGGRMSGNLTVPLNGGPAAGKLSGQFESLDAVSALIGQDIRGAASFQVAFNDSSGQQGVTGHLEGDELAATLSPGRTLMIKHVTASTSGDVAKLAQGVPFSVDASGVSGEGLSLDSLSVSGNTNFHSVDYKVNVKGHYHGAMTLHASGSADWDKPEKHFSLASLDATHAKAQIHLAKPATVVLSDGGMELGPTTIEIGDGSVELSLKRGSQSLRGHADFTDFPLELVRDVTNASPAMGQLSGKLDIDATSAKQTGTATLHLTNLAMTRGTSAANRMDGSIDLHWRNGELNLDGTLSGRADAKIAVKAAVPLQFDPDLASLSVPKDGRLRGNITWNADIDPFWNAFGPDTQILQGRADASLKLAGTVSDPAVMGDIKLHDGRFVDLEMGTVLEKLTLNLEASRHQIKLISASATDGGSGKVTASGSLGLGRGKDFPVSVDVKADKAKLVRRTDVTVTASGELNFTKQGKSSLLKGDIHTDEVDAILVDLSNPDVVNLNVKEIGPDGKVMVSHKPSESADNPAATKIDVAVHVPGKAFIRGRGLDSEWKGDLKITGTVKDPQIVGQFNVVRGNFKFAGRTFDLQRGQVSFQGGKKIDPELNVQAVYSVQDLTATAQITGPSSSPDVTLSSMPALPQDEILSRILFGSSVADLSPLQAVQLADAVRELGKPGGGLLGSARSAIGLDVLQIGSGQPGGGVGSTTITGGKYIGKNVYLQVETAPDGSQEKVGVDVGVTKNLSVQSDVSQKQGSRIGLKWKHDY